MENKSLDSMQIVVRRVKDVCCWKYEGNNYKTGCNNDFLLNNGGPYDNNFKFCPYCGVSLHIGEKLLISKYHSARISLNMSEEDYEIVMQALQDKLNARRRKREPNKKRVKKIK